MELLTYTQRVKALMDFVTSYEYETPEEVDEALRSAGYDPDEVAKKLKERIGQLLDEARKRTVNDE